MGVLACDRNGCDQIMCDTCIEGRWYVCPDCQSEFRSIIGQSPIQRAEMLAKFESFMQSEKRCDRGSEPATVGDFFKESTRG